MELFDICDEQGNPTGDTVERSEAHAKGICHRTAHIWIAKQENGRYKVLLQKRSMDKDSFPGRYDTSSAGHIQAGDEPMESALRELGEELGIKAEAADLDFAGTFRIRYEKEFQNVQGQRGGICVRVSETGGHSRSDNTEGRAGRRELV